MTTMTNDIKTANIMIKKIPHYVRNINISAVFFVFVVLMLIVGEVFAVNDVFAKVSAKGDTIITGLRDIAVVIATIAIMIVAFMMYKGRIGNQMAFGIIIGSIVLGAAAEIADLLIN